MIRYGIAGLIMLIYSSCGEESVEDKQEQLNNLRQEKAQLEEKIHALEEALSDDPESMDAGRRQPVVTKELKKRSFSHYIEVQGEAYTDQNVMLSPEATGIVKSVNFEEGAWLEQGSVIMQLDDENVRDNIEEVKTDLDLAKTIYERQKNLWEKQIGSEVEYLRAKNDMDRLEKRLRTLNTQLRQTRVKAPFSGYLDELIVNEGEYVSPSVQVARVINPENMKLRANVSERYRDRIAGLDSALVTLSALDHRQKLPIHHISHLIAPGDRTFRVSVKISNPEHRLKPNMLATLALKDYHNESVITVPVDVIHHERGEQFVFLATGESGQPVADKRKVKTGKTYNGQTEILEGLDSGEKLITRGHSNVSDGDRLDIRDN